MSDSGHPTAGGRDTENGVFEGQKNDARRAPGAGDEKVHGAREIRNCPMRLCRQIEAEEFTAGGDGDMPAIRRPDRLGRIFRALDLYSLKRGKGSKIPETGRVSVTGCEGDAGTVRGEYGTVVDAEQRRGGEAEDGRRLTIFAQNVRAKQRSKNGEKRRRDPGSARAGGRPGSLGSGYSGFGDPLQCFAEIAGRLPARFRIFGETPAEQPIESGRRKGVEGGDRGWFGCENGGDDAGRVGAIEGGPARQHFIEHGAEREDVTAGCRPLCPAIAPGDMYFSVPRIVPVGSACRSW